MKPLENIRCQIAEDIRFIEEAEQIDLEKLSELSSISKHTLYEIIKGGKASSEVYEKFYSYAFSTSYRISQVREEFLKESEDTILFHGSKNGIKNIDCNGSRLNCDFGKGFYLGETYESAFDFVCEFRNSCIYSFKLNQKGLKIKTFEFNLEWVLAICYFRGQLKEYESHPLVKKIAKEVNSADVIIAPIADNKMFYIMSLFTNGEINDNVTIHSLAASKLGMQYVIKTEKALNNLTPIEKYYLSEPERNECREKLEKRSFEIDTKLKMAKREYREGKFIEEILS